MKPNPLETAPHTPLAESKLQATITDFLAEYELRHVFRNARDHAVEAVYSFPIPLDSAFLGMQATLAGETLTATVMPARRATRNYDAAISEGDGAVLLERLEPGMLCVNLGNLKPGEDGEVVLRFAAMLGVAGRVARFSLPLVHRPRYGRSRLDDVVRPGHDFAVEHPLEAEIRIRGLLASVPVRCATGAAQFRQESNETVLKLDRAMLDRDLVLNFELPNAMAFSGRWLEDGDRTLAVLSFLAPAPDGSRARAPRDVCLVMDGSGSMSGDAIAQSRHALRAMAAALHASDRVQVLRFGSTVVPLFRRPLRASERVTAALAQLAGTLAADLGGTEMADALHAAIQSLATLDGPTGQKVVILVTDGAVNAHEIEAAQREATQAGIRIFVVAVGSSAGVEVLAPLAEMTAATLERAVPAEPVDAAVMRQLQRARTAGPLELDIEWGEGASPLPLGVVYPGDAVIAMATLPVVAARPVAVSIPSAAKTFSLALEPAENVPAWRAWIGQQAYRHAAEEDREAIALRYGLITDETSAVLVKIRADGEKADGLPVVVPVAHMVPAGMVVSASDMCDAYDMCDMSDMTPRTMRLSSRQTASAEYLDLPAFLRRQASATEDPTPEFADSVDMQSTPTPLWEHAVREIRLALRRALDKLLFADAVTTLDINRLLEAIEPAMHADVRRYLAEHKMQRFGIKTAYKLLEALASDGIGPPLIDDQEARLALLRGGCVPGCTLPH